MDDWPSHTDELARKTLTALARLVEDEKVSPAEVRMVSGYLYDTVAGLVPKEVSNIVLQVYGSAS